MNQFRSIAGSHFGLAIGVLLLSVAVHDAVALRNRSRSNRGKQFGSSGSRNLRKNQTKK